MDQIWNSFNRRFRGLFYIPIQGAFFLILTIILSLVLSLVLINAVGLAFKTLFPNIGSYGIFLILATCLLGSYVNIPLKRYKTLQPIVKIRRVTVFGITYPIPSIQVGFYETILAVNVGGAIVPTATSIYLMANSIPGLPNILAATAVVAVVVKVFSRPVKGAGIIVPALIPPITAALAGTLLGGAFTHIAAYVSGSIGTLIGADLLNIRKILRLGAPISSIGGAGTFDGIFLAGIIGVLLAS